MSEKSYTRITIHVKYFLCHTIIIPSLTIVTFNIPITVYTLLSGRIITLPPLWLLSERVSSALDGDLTSLLVYQLVAR